ncbi:hypothetical protein [Thermococcus sp. JCM 11816]
MDEGIRGKEGESLRKKKPKRPKKLEEFTNFHIAPVFQKVLKWIKS